MEGGAWRSAHQGQQPSSAFRQQQLTFEELMREASKSPVDQLTGKMRCLECGKLFNECMSLGRHLRDRHGGRNGSAMYADVAGPSGRPGVVGARAAYQQQQQRRIGQHPREPRPSLTLGDVMLLKAQQQSAQQEAPLRGLGAGAMPVRQRDMGGRSLARQPLPPPPSFGKQREGPPKRKLSRIKRTLLREKADKAVAQAVSACDGANAALKASSELLESTNTQLKEAMTKLQLEQAQGSVATKLCTEVQVLRLAKDQAEQQLQLAIRRALVAEEEKQCKLAERAQLWSNAGSANAVAQPAVHGSSQMGGACSANHNAGLVLQQQQAACLGGFSAAVGGGPHAAVLQQLVEQQQQAAGWSPGLQAPGVYGEAPMYAQHNELAAAAHAVAGWAQEQAAAAPPEWALAQAQQVQQQQQCGPWAAQGLPAAANAVLHQVPPRAPACTGAGVSNHAAAEQLLASCKEMLQQQQLSVLAAAAARSEALVLVPPPAASGPRATERQASSASRSSTPAAAAAAAVLPDAAAGRAAAATGAAPDATPSWLLDSDSDSDDDDEGVPPGGSELLHGAAGACTDSDDDGDDMGALSGQVDVLSRWMTAANIGEYSRLASAASKGKKQQQQPKQEAQQQPSRDGAASAAAVASAAHELQQQADCAVPQPLLPPPAVPAAANQSYAADSLPPGVAAASVAALIEGGGSAASAAPHFAVPHPSGWQPSSAAGDGGGGYGGPGWAETPSPHVADAPAAGVAAPAHGSSNSVEGGGVVQGVLPDHGEAGGPSPPPPFASPVGQHAQASGGELVSGQQQQQQVGPASQQGSSSGPTHPLKPALPSTVIASTTITTTSSSLLSSSDYHCDICGTTCSTLQNFEQHSQSRKHLRRAGSVAASRITAQLRQPAIAAASSSGGGSSLAAPSVDAMMALTSPPSEDRRQVHHTTYIGPRGQCREYCTQVISADLNQVVAKLLAALCFWQERAKQMEPTKAAMRKRLVCGLREVAKAVKLQKARAVVVAPNIEACDSQGGPDDLLAVILAGAQVAGTPVVFALTRKKMGQVFGSRKKMSAVAVINFSGADEMFSTMLSLAAQGREQWLQIQQLNQQH